MKLKIDTVSEHRGVLSPYPFDVDPLEVSFPARLVPKKSYSSPEEFLQDFYTRRADNHQPHAEFVLMQRLRHAAVKSAATRLHPLLADKAP